MYIYIYRERERENKCIHYHILNLLFRRKRQMGKKKKLKDSENIVFPNILGIS